MTCSLVGWEIQSQSGDAISLSHIVHACLSQITGAMSN